jgi:glutaconate CoA-transferase subunit A
MRWVAGIDALVDGITDGARVGVSGFHFTRAPIMALRALAATGVTGLHYVAWGGGLPLELLLEHGAVARATLCFASLDVFGPAPRFRRAMESGELELDEWTALGIINGFRAAGENLPFEVMQSPEGSSLAAGFARGLDGPFGAGGPPVSAVPPLPMDVLLLHAQRADDDGNVELAGARGLDMPAIFAADRVYVTVEERVRRGELGAARSFVVPRTFVTRVAEVPFGAYPTSCLPYYPADFRALREIVDAGPAGPLPGLTPAPARRTVLTERAALPAARVAEALAERPVAAPPEYTTDELMVCVLARTIGPDGVCSVGAASPLPTAAYLLAKHLWAPDLLLMSHNGGLVDLPVRPLSLAAAEFLDHHLAAAHTGGDETYHWYYQRGLITHEVVGAAQVDGTGATNNLWVSKQDGTPVRLPGQGGMADVANLHANFIVYLPRQATRNLVAKLGTVSARRAWHDEEQRRRYGLRPGRTIVLTDLGMFAYDQDRGALTLRTLHPGADLDDLRARTGFEVITAPDLTTTEPPTERELTALRTVVDPLGVRRLDTVASAQRQHLIDALLDTEEQILDDLVAHRAEQS